MPCHPEREGSCLWRDENLAKSPYFSSSSSSKLYSKCLETAAVAVFVYITTPITVHLRLLIGYFFSALSSILPHIETTPTCKPRLHNVTTPMHFDHAHNQRVTREYKLVCTHTRAAWKILSLFSLSLLSFPSLPPSLPLSCSSCPLLLLYFVDCYWNNNCPEKRGTHPLTSGSPLLTMMVRETAQCVCVCVSNAVGLEPLLLLHAN